MKTRERVELENMLGWAIRKMFENHPEIEIGWEDVWMAAQSAWQEVMEKENASPRIPAEEGSSVLHTSSEYKDKKPTRKRKTK